ncbi:PfkB family carbohydrate kinase [Angustibacter peucedani]
MEPDGSRPAPAPGPAGGSTSEGFDLLLAGTVFFDLIFTGLPERPATGTEVWAEGMGSCPGGVANVAIAASRLGLRTSLAAAFGDDSYGDFNWTTLHQQEGVDLSRSKRYDGWHSPVTVSMSVDRDRSMVSHGHAPPEDASTMIGDPPPARAALVDLAPQLEPWARKAADQGTLLFADTGWDPTGEWSSDTLAQLEHYHAFLPNSVEAMAYTRTDDPWAALYALADRVPIAVVTAGAHGALAVDSTTGEEEWVPALPVTPLDPTGAGDVFAAAFVTGTLAGWPLADRLGLANLTAALAVQQFGGSLAAPGWGDVADWWHLTEQRATGAPSQWLRRYAFLADVVHDVPGAAVRRASATIGRQSDAQRARARSRKASRHGKPAGQGGAFGLP